MEKSTDLGTSQIDLNLASSKEELYLMLYPLGAAKLADLLAQLGSQYPLIAEELRRFAASDPAFRKIFVRGVNYSTSEETLHAAYKVHGDIEEINIITDKLTGRPRGIAFITYKDLESAESALRAPSKLIDGRIVVCQLASDSPCYNNPAFAEQKKLYICGLSPETTTETLLHFFGKYGEIEEGSIAREKGSRRSRGFGFVTYKTVEAAKKAILDPEKKLCGKELTVRFADSRKGNVMRMQYSLSSPPLLPMPTDAPRAVPCVNPVAMKPIGRVVLNTAGSSYVQPTASYPMRPVGPPPFPFPAHIPYLPQFPFVPPQGAPKSPPRPAQ